MTRDSRQGGVRHEATLAARWAAGEWRGQLLRAERGERFRLIFEGRRGGGAGPDFRDAVIERADGTRLRGDIELHLRAADWRAHGHATDPRYNDVVLHVVLSAARAETRLASGAVAPVVVLRSPITEEAPPVGWPCSGMVDAIGHAGMRRILVEAGRERFQRRAAALRQALIAHDRESVRDGAPIWSCADRVLFVELAEGLGYGRDRAALRDAGERLARGVPPAVVLQGVDRWQRVERLRLRGLASLVDRWGGQGPWRAFSAALRLDPPRAALWSVLAALAVPGGCVSPGRARILAANVVLPFAAAQADQTGDRRLAMRAGELFLALPGLPANQITREMRRQLGLPKQPRGAAAQQGLHHIWTSWCRDKRCSGCPCNRHGDRAAGASPAAPREPGL